MFAVRLPGIAPSRRERALWALLLLVAALSVAAGFHDALARSQDFQWSGERILLAHLDPWAQYLAGDPGHRFVASQIPNYLPILYVLIIPLGLLPATAAKFLWAVCNLSFILGSGVLAGRAYGLSRKQIALIVCLFLAATPTRNSIGNGQQGLLVLFLWCATLLAPQLTNSRAALAGLAYFKYSFGPPMIFYLLFRWGVRAVLLSAIPALASLALVWLWLPGAHDLVSLGRLALEPLVVANRAFSSAPHDPNLMNLVESLVHGLSGTARSGLAFALALTLCGAVSAMAFRHRGAHAVEWQMALMATMSFALFKHHAYDGVVLLLPFCYALRHRQRREARIALAGMGYFFYLQRLLDAAHLHPVWTRVPEFALLMTILTVVYRLRPEPHAAEATVTAPRTVRRQSRAAA